MKVTVQIQIRDFDFLQEMKYWLSDIDDIAAVWRDDIDNIREAFEQAFQRQAEHCMRTREIPVDELITHAVGAVISKKDDLRGKIMEQLPFKRKRSYP